MLTSRYSWDDNQLRSYLEKKGVIKTKQQATRDELLAKMQETYAKATNPVWQAWSDSYIVSTLFLASVCIADLHTEGVARIPRPASYGGSKDS